MSHRSLLSFTVAIVTTMIGLGCLSMASAAPSAAHAPAKEQSHTRRHEKNLRLRVEQLEATVRELQAVSGGRIPAELEQRISAVESTLGDLQGRIPANLEQRISRLESDVGELQALSVPLDVEVNCAAGDSIGAVLASHASALAPLTIRISGTCNEAVIIARSKVTLAGQNGATIQAPAAAYAIKITDGAVHISVSNLTLLGGVGAANVGKNAHAMFSNVVAETGLGMVSMDNGTMFITGSVLRNATWGAYALRGGVINISNSTIEANHYGIHAVGGTINVSNVLPDGSPAPAGVVLRNNNKGGAVRAGGVIEVGASRIESNQTEGLLIRRASSVVFLDSANTISNNGTWGVLCDTSSSYTLNIGTSPGTVSGNRSGSISSNCQ